MKTLKCFSKDPHEAHNWQCKWDRPPTQYACPGVKNETEEKK